MLVENRLNMKCCLARVTLWLFSFRFAQKLVWGDKGEGEKSNRRRNYIAISNYHFICSCRDIVSIHWIESSDSSIRRHSTNLWLFYDALQDIADMPSANTVRTLRMSLTFAWAHYMQRQSHQMQREMRRKREKNRGHSCNRYRWRNYLWSNKR